MAEQVVISCHPNAQKALEDMAGWVALANTKVALHSFIFFRKVSFFHSALLIHVEARLGNSTQGRVWNRTVCYLGHQTCACTSISEGQHGFSQDSHMWLSTGVQVQGPSTKSWNTLFLVSSTHKGYPSWAAMSGTKRITERWVFPWQCAVKICQGDALRKRCQRQCRTVLPVLRCCPSDLMLAGMDSILWQDLRQHPFDRACCPCGCSQLSTDSCEWHKKVGVCSHPPGYHSVSEDLTWYTFLTSFLPAPKKHAEHATDLDNV